jgi:hypothetical protein
MLTIDILLLTLHQNFPVMSERGTVLVSFFACLLPIPDYYVPTMSYCDTIFFFLLASSIYVPTINVNPLCNT